MIGLHERQEPPGYPWLLRWHIVKHERASDPGSPNATCHDAASDIAFQGAEPLGRIQEETTISGLNTVHGQVVSHDHSSLLPFCVHFSSPVTGKTATLDTGRRAKPYPGGIPTR